MFDTSRHVRVHCGDAVLADSHRPRMLVETGLPVRWYVPVADVDDRLLEPSPTTSQCPYKGVAHYRSVRGGPADVAWSYRFPVPEAVRIAGLVAFFGERTSIVVDGVPQSSPRSRRTDPGRPADRPR